MSRFKRLFTRHVRFWTWFVLGGIFAFIFALLLLPSAIRWGAQRWLRRQGLGTAIIEDVEFNPFTGRLAVFSVFSIQTEDKRMNLGRSEINLNWRPLLSRRIDIAGFTIENVLIDVNVTSDGTVSVGGLTYTPQPGPSEPSTGRPWEIGIGPINLHNVTLVVREPRVQGRIDIWDAHMDPMDSARPDAPTNFIMAMGVNGGSLRLGGTTRPFKIDSTTTASLRLEHLPLAWLGGLARAQGIGGLGGNLDARAGLKIRPAAGAFALDCRTTVSLKNLCLRTSDTTLANLSIDWGGGVATTTDGLKVAGSLKLSDLDAALVKERLAIRQKEFGWRGEVARGGGGNVSIRCDAVARGTRITSRSLPLLQLEEAAVQSGRLDVTSGTKAIDLAVGLKLSGLRADWAGMTVGQGELGWQGKVECALTSPVEVRVRGDLSARKLALRDRASSTALALESLAWNDASIRQKGALVDVGGKVALGGLKGRFAPQGVEASQKELRWAGDVSYDTAAGGMKMAAQVAGAGLAVRDVKKDVRLLDLKLLEARDTVVRMKLGAEGASVTLAAETRLGGLKARVPEPALSVWQEELDWKGRVSYAPGRRGGIEHDGDLKIEGLTVEDRRNGLNALDLESVAVRGAHFKSPESAEVKSVRFGQTRLLERALRATALTTHTHTVSLRELALGGLSYDGKRAAVETVKATRLVGVFVRAADGTLELGKWTGAPEADGSKAAEAAKADAPKPEGPALQFRVGRVELDGDSRLYVRDGSAKPPAFLSLRQIRLEADEIDSSKPDAASPFKLSAGLGRYATLNVEGTVAPFAPTPTATVDTRVDAMELPVFSPYTQQYIGYKLMSGTLSLKSGVRIDAGILKSQNDLTLRMFELEKLRPNESDAVSAQLGYPVNTALAMLRDANGDINLKIPVEGDLRNPQVGILGILRKAMLNGTANSIRSAMQVVYAPLGAVVSVGGKVTGSALACKPIEFAAGQAAVEGESAAYLDKLAGIMKSRPGLRVSFSGRATRGDAAALAKAEAVEKYGVLGKLASRGGDEKKPEPIEPAVKEKLTRLANRRASAAIDYLVKAGIKGDRLFRRAAAVDEAAAAKPRVEIAF